jgi:phenylacetate-coenzyme A ligase PaaK-like adenylate-forming protein
LKTVFDFERIFELSPYGLNRVEKDALYHDTMSQLTLHHRDKCEAYRRITDIAGLEAPLPVRLFKEYDLLSVARDEVVKTMTSSGTTGQAVSKIFLDRDTSARQSKTLSRIVSDFTGKARMPMLVIDSSAILKNRAMFSARGAGILGFSMLGRDITYALDENMEMNLPVVEEFLVKHAGESVILFGFTFIIWLHFCLALKNKNRKLDLNGVLIHGGGWKKLSDQSVDNGQFSQAVYELTGIEKVYNYYGMVEQTGSIFMECEHGHLHASVFSDIIIRGMKDFSSLERGIGVIECDSVLPTSYPGHRLLTEDEGEILGVDDCPCGRLGKYFKIYGRIKGAEIRGCSDTYERR